MESDILFLKVGDSSTDGKISIIDEDRLCFQVRGANGSIRTISKDLLREFIEYFNQHTNASSSDARNDLSGKSDIDKFEYGYNGTLTKLSELNKSLSHRRNKSAAPANNKITDFPLQQIFFGAPGTGKSFVINEVCADYENYRTTFHPDTDYASFVGSYKPITIMANVRDMTGHPVTENGKAVKESRIVYRYVMQAFLKAYVAAWREQQKDEPKPVFLIVEEINRGNCAQIFGDIFQLLDRNAAGFSDYPIVADDDLAQELKEILCEFNIARHDAINALYRGGKDVVGMVKNGECLLLPNNMYIWATMNTSDQSLFPIDSAFKRRWDWNYIKIKDAGENFKIVFSNGNTYDWWEFISAINKRIEGGEIQQEDKKLGYFFAKAREKVISPKVLLSKVLFYLYNDVFKDFGLDEEFFKDENGETMSFASYFNESGEADEERIERFVSNLGLIPISSVNRDSITTKGDADDNVPPGTINPKLSVTFTKNGKTFNTGTLKSIYIDSLIEIGLERAAEAFDSKNYTLPRVTKSPVATPDPARSYVKADDEWYVLCGPDIYPYYPALEFLNSELDLGLKIEHQ